MTIRNTRELWEGNASGSLAGQGSGAEFWLEETCPVQGPSFAHTGRWQGVVDRTALWDSADQRSRLQGTNSVTSESFLTCLGSSFLNCRMPVEDLGQTLRIPPALTFCDSRCSYMSPGSKAPPCSLLEKKERKREKKSTSINLFIAQPMTMNHGIINPLLYTCLVPWLGASHSQALLNSSFVDRYGIFLVASHWMSSKPPD